GVCALTWRPVNLTRGTRGVCVGLRAHLLPLGDEAGPSPAPYALHGVDLAHQPDKRPWGWEEELDFGGVRLAGLRSPLTMWLIEGGELNVVVDAGCDMGGTAGGGRRGGVAWR